jgi:hypothetical protein
MDDDNNNRDRGKDFLRLIAGSMVTFFVWKICQAVVGVKIDRYIEARERKG